MFALKMRWRTYKDLLNSATCDLRYEKGVEQDYNTNGRIPNLYVVNIKFENQIYSIYINDKIRVIDILKKLIDLKKVSIDSVDDSYLKTEDGKKIFQYYDTIQFPNDVFDVPLNLILQKRNNQENPIQIFVKALTGNLMTFEVQKTDTIQWVKCKIFLRYSIAIEQQQLLFEGKKLEDKTTLESANIKSEDVLHLCLQK